MAGSESSECYSITISGCRWITALVDLICALLVGGVFCVTSDFAMFVANTRVVFSIACAAAVFRGALGHTVMSKAVKTEVLFLITSKRDGTSLLMSQLLAEWFPLQ